MNPSRRESIVTDVIERLRHDFPRARAARIERIVSEEYDALMANHISIEMYVANLIEHSARERLTDGHEVHQLTSPSDHARG
jgi:hypothetical protein